MEFRANQVARDLNQKACQYFTEHLAQPSEGIKLFTEVQQKLGNAVKRLPDWHPLETALRENQDTRQLFDHTQKFVRGLLTCPYDESKADQLVREVNNVPGLSAEKLREPLYAESAYPVCIEAEDVNLEADGTVRSRDALRWFVKETVKHARDTQVAETWWNIRTVSLGSPHGARSSLVVNEHTGRHMRNILEAMNDSGMFGPVKEVSLEMFSERKRDSIAQTLLRAALEAAPALDSVGKTPEKFTFELRGEVCNGRVQDTWGDGVEYRVRVSIGEDALDVSGFYYPKNDRIQHMDPTGKKAVAKKFL